MKLTNKDGGKDGGQFTKECRQEHAEGSSASHKSDTSNSVVDQSASSPAENVDTQSKTYEKNAPLVLHVNGG